jgi:large subunit ribosomal protein L23
MRMGVLRYPISTEKSAGFIDRQNLITYMVDFRASKGEIRNEFEERFGVRVAAVRTVNTPKNEKKAFIKLAKGSNAGEVAMKLKLV